MTDYAFTVRAVDSLGRIALSPQSVFVSPWGTTIAELLFNGADGSTTITETTGRSVSRFGNAQIDTAWAAEGTGSLLLDGSGDYLTLVHDTNFNALGDLRIECAVRPADVGVIRNIASKRASGALQTGWDFSVNADGTVAFAVWDTAGNADIALTSTTLLTANNPFDVAVESVSDVWTLYVNGVAEATDTRVNTLSTNTQLVYIGRGGTTTTRDWNGWIDRFRFLRP